MPAEDTPHSALDALPITLKCGEIRWRVRSTDVAERIEDLLLSPEAAILRACGTIRDTIQVTIARIAMPIAPGGMALMRRSNYGKESVRRRDSFRPAGVMRAFRNALALERAGIPTPRIYAAGIVRSLHVPKTGYLLVEEISPAVTLAEMAEKADYFEPRAIRCVAEAIANMHRLGFIHGDLTINNVLMDGHLRPWFIDLERTSRRPWPLGWRGAVDEFHRFARHVGKLRPAARFAALRLLIHYCRLRGWAGKEREFADDLHSVLVKKFGRI